MLTLNCIETPGSATSGLLYKSRVRTEPTNLTAPQWTNALWARLDAMITDLGEACIKVIILSVNTALIIEKDLISVTRRFTLWRKCWCYRRTRRQVKHSWMK